MLIKKTLKKKERNNIKTNETYSLSRSSSYGPRALTICSTSSATTFSSVSSVHGWYVRGEKRAEGAHVCTLARTRDTTPVPAPPLLRAPFPPSIANETAWWRCNRTSGSYNDKVKPRTKKSLYIPNFYNFFEHVFRVTAVQL